MYRRWSSHKEQAVVQGCKDQQHCRFREFDTFALQKITRKPIKWAFFYIFFVKFSSYFCSNMHVLYDIINGRW